MTPPPQPAPVAATNGGGGSSGAAAPSTPPSAPAPVRVYLPPARADGVPSDLLSLPARSVAEWLALEDSLRFQRIDPSECLRKSWMVPKLKKNARNVLTVSAHFNAVSFWAQWEIAFEGNLKERARIMCRLVEIATECLKMNAFSAAFAIHAAFTSAPVYRLENTKKAMAGKDMRSKDVVTKVEQLQKQLSHEFNFRAPLSLLEKCAPPCVPFLGIFQQQLVAVEEGSPDTIKPKVEGGMPLINFAKRRKISEIIRKIQTYQIGSYDFEPPKEVAAYCAPRVHKWEAALLEGSLNGDTSYKRALESTFDRASQRCEPRRGASSGATATRYESIDAAPASPGVVEVSLERTPRQGNLLTPLLRAVPSSDLTRGRRSSEERLP